MKKIWVITLFPEYFEALKQGGVIAQVFEGKRGPELQLEVLQLRDFSSQDYKGVDDNPYGGGHGMVMRADILKNALSGIMEKGEYAGEIKDHLHVVYTSPRGKVWNAKSAKEFSQKLVDTSKDVVFICGRYEGIDERFVQKYVDEEISLGDFVLSGGEIAVMTIIDSALRFLPGVLGNENSYEQDSFEGEGILECPFYTRPSEFEGVKVPDVLLSGDHKKIAEYRQAEAIRITEKYRPELLTQKDK